MIIPAFIRQNVELAKYSTLAVGGPADYFVDIKDESDLLSAFKFAREGGVTNTFPIGSGSNILFSDSGFRGLILRMRLNRLRYQNDELWADAGMLVSEIIKFTENGIGGFECFAGLPGTIGGAIYGNAGCYGGQFWDAIEAVKFFDGENFVVLDANEGMFHYRWSFFKEHPDIIVSAKLKAAPKNAFEVVEANREIMTKRKQSQPSRRSIGCFFKNPKVGGKIVSAGQLIDKAGLKGMKLGRVEISPVHANFFTNLGGAKAKDFFNLAKVARGKVFECFGVLLEKEIVEVGEF